MSTYKLGPDAPEPEITIKGVYGHEHAFRVVEASLKDYEEFFPQQ